MEMLVRDNIVRKLYIPIKRISEQEAGICIGYCLKEDIISSFKKKIVELNVNIFDCEECNENCLLHSNRKTILNDELLNITKNIILNEFNSLTVNYSILTETLNEVISCLKCKYEFCQTHKKYFNNEYLISVYIKCGLFRKEGSNNSNLVFTTPNMGLFVDFLESGNNSILNSIKRNKDQEVTEDRLNSIKLGRSKLSLDFHLRYLSGVGYIKRK
ncbi:hypothetical protein FG386_000996 [Cryptosporidium ryanae]|uniref:uncharacterized protein n=1 Tax=Cryptosporidium ryanae TaxID=515981 RepID=UPI003519ED20|nr:hypothetical protein FG386_000996 [Cryptosporidium ryanae]